MDHHLNNSSHPNGYHQFLISKDFQTVISISLSLMMFVAMYIVKVYYFKNIS